MEPLLSSSTVRLIPFPLSSFVASHPDRQPTPSEESTHWHGGVRWSAVPNSQPGKQARSTETTIVALWTDNAGAVALSRRSSTSSSIPVIAEAPQDNEAKRASGKRGTMNGAGGEPTASDLFPDDDEEEGDVDDEADDDDEEEDAVGTFSTDDLLRIETALSLRVNHSPRKPPTTATSGGVPRIVVSFDDFYALRDKVQFHSSNAITTAASDRAATTRRDNLSEAERHLYHFLRLAVPTLYQLVLPGEGNCDPGAAPPSPAGIEWVPFPGSRTAELRRLLLLDPGDRDRAKERQIRAAIVNHRHARTVTVAVRGSSFGGSNPPPRGPSSSLAASGLLNAAGKVAPPPILRPGMTLDERVRARDQARRDRETAQVSTAVPSLDRPWLIRLADALWQYSSDLVARQSRYQSPRSSSSSINRLSSGGPSVPRHCAVTLKDAVAYLGRTVSGGWSSTVGGLATSQGDKWSRRALAESILQLAQIAPDWIQLHGRDNGGTHSAQAVSKNATVWIYHDRYQKARDALTGHPPRINGSTTCIRDGRIDAVQPPLSSSSSKLSIVRSNGAPSDPHTLPANKRPWAVSATTTPPPTTTHGAVVPHSVVTTDDDRPVLSYSIPKKPRLDPALHTPPTGGSSASVLSPPRSSKASPTLRINPHLILSDADHSKFRTRPIVLSL